MCGKQNQQQELLLLTITFYDQNLINQPKQVPIDLIHHHNIMTSRKDKANLFFLFFFLKRSGLYHNVTPPWNMECSNKTGDLQQSVLDWWQTQLTKGFMIHSGGKLHFCAKPAHGHGEDLKLNPKLRTEEIYRQFRCLWCEFMIDSQVSSGVMPTSDWIDTVIQG